MKKEDLKKLAEPIKYKTRVGPGGKSLAYIDARQAQDRLDEVCGIENWKVEYQEHRGELFAGVSIKIDGEWITKWDGGSESNIEKEKGAISDSFKRACVVWGLGRFLYDIKPTSVKPDNTLPEKKKWLNYEDLVAIADAGNTTEEQVAKIIKEDGYNLSGPAKNAVRHYVETGELDKNLFFKK